jgi:hypothetical protein
MVPKIDVALEESPSGKVGFPLETEEKNERGVTPRVVAFSLLIAAAFAYIIPVADYKFSNTFLGATHLPPGAIAVLLLLMVVVNPLIRLVSQKLTFSRNETLTVYLTCLFSTLVPGIGGNNYFVSFIIGSFYFSTRENRWFDYLKGLPPWFTPALNPDGTYNRWVVEAWYNGLAQGQTIPWGAWLIPLLAWGLFMLATFVMTGCLSVMLRAQWGQNEALAFPLLRLPLEMTDGMDEQGGNKFSKFFRNPMMWTGFAVAAFIQFVNGLSFYYPDFPSIPLELNTSPLFTEAPWNQMGGVTIRVFPIAVGIAYLMTSEISFSCWFFLWFFKFQLMASFYAGFPPSTLPTVKGIDGNVMTAFQEVGAYFGYFGLVMWAARGHLGHIFKRATGRIRAGDGEKSEALSYPLAFWGFTAAFLTMVIWGICAGMNPLLSIALWLSYLVIAVVLSRVVAESGLLFVHQNWMPLGVLSGLVGMGPNAPLSLTHGIVPAAAMEYTVIQDFRGNLMPSFVQAFKLAHDRRIAGRPLFALIFSIILVGMMIGFTMNVRLGYENGGLGLQGWLSNWGPSGMGSQVSALSSGIQPISAGAWFWTGFGVFLTAGMMLLRSRFAWFPLHPIGYLMAQSYPIQVLWFSMFIGWSSKTLITRFGGTDSYRRTIPLFLGLALGDVAMMLFWLLIDGWQGRIGHQLMPG